LNPTILRVAAGAGIGYFVIKKFFRKPLRRLAVCTAKGALNLADGVESTGQAVTRGWHNIIEEAKTEIEKKKDSRVMREAGSMVEKASSSVAGYMHKTAETIENLADQLEYRDKETSEDDSEDDREK